MDLDIFKRKILTRGYSCLSVENGFVIYKPLAVENKNKIIELTIQSNTLSEKNTNDSLQLSLTRFPEQAGGEIMAATIICKGLEEMSLACAQIDLLTSNSMKSPFEEALTGQNLKFQFRRSTWIKK